MVAVGLTLPFISVGLASDPAVAEVYAELCWVPAYAAICCCIHYSHTLSFGSLDRHSLKLTCCWKAANWCGELVNAANCCCCTCKAFCILLWLLSFSESAYLTTRLDEEPYTSHHTHCMIGTQYSEYKEHASHTSNHFNI